ncbi:hypothetical protein EVAR_826_1 [Eumeta japonica]|uniref:Uncharacterized protein n=1 Tax=Eumeta variegata TaxID=151549 RepID=A0A4C1SGA1_EUMVA|nr:hypothetical protein EVAR_826_1 [Eumeta japonica]
MLERRKASQTDNANGTQLPDKFIRTHRVIHLKRFPENTAHGGRTDFGENPYKRLAKPLSREGARPNIFETGPIIIPLRGVGVRRPFLRPSGHTSALQLRYAPTLKRSGIFGSLRGCPAERNIPTSARITLSSDTYSTSAYALRTVEFQIWPPLASNMAYINPKYRCAGALPPADGQQLASRWHWLYRRYCARVIPLFAPQSVLSVSAFTSGIYVRTLIEPRFTGIALSEKESNFTATKWPTLGCFKGDWRRFPDTKLDCVKPGRRLSGICSSFPALPRKGALFAVVIRRRFINLKTGGSGRTRTTQIGNDEKL